MTTPPIDANIQARIDKAIDEKFFGMESLNLQEGIDDLKSRVESIELSDLQEQISGLSVRAAARKLRVPRSTLQRWLAQKPLETAS